MARIRSQGRSFVLGALVTALPVMAQEATSWNSRLKDGLAAINSGHYQQAVQILTVLAEESESFAAADVRRSENAILLATAYQYESRAELAEPLYLQAKDALTSAGPAARRLLGNALHGLAQLRTTAGRWQEAEELLQSAGDMCRDGGGDRDPCALAATVHLGQLYVLQDRSPEAERILVPVIGSLREKSPPRDDLLADALHNLANVYRQQGRYEAAEPLLKEALELNRQFGESNPMLADRLVDLGGLYTLEHNAARAEPLLKKAVSIYEISNDPHLADALHELGVIALEEGKYAIARQDFEQSFGIYQKTFGPGDVSIARAEAGLAQAYLGERNYKEADSLIQRAIAIGRAVLGDAHFGVAKLFMVAARVQERLHRSSEADLYYRQALTIYRRSLPQDHPERAAAERQYAQFRKALGK